MKRTQVIIGMISLLITSMTYADSLKSQSQQNNTNQKGTVHLDQSQNIFFEQFSANTYALQLLQSRSQFRNHDLIIGGSLQADLQHWQGDTIALLPSGNYQEGNGLYLTQVALDLMNNINNWSTIFISAADAHVAHEGNSVYFPHAFLLLGNLDQVPLYLTAGINFVPYGSFASVGPWDTPLTGAYFNPSQAPQVSLGYFLQDLNLVATEYTDEANHQKHTAYSLYYNKTIGNFNYNLGLGYVTHLTTNSTGNTPVTKQRKINAPALNMGGVEDINASVGYGAWTLIGEFVRGLRTVGVNAGQPKALSINVSYAPTILDKTTTFGLGRSNSMHLNEVPVSLSGGDALPVALSGLKNNWAVSVARSIFMDNITLGLELERATTYSNQHTYTATMDLMAYL